MLPSAWEKGRERDRVSPCWTLPGATRESLVKFGVATVRMIADVETRVAEGERTKLKDQIPKANGTENSVWLVQSSLYFVEEKSRLIAVVTPRIYRTFSATNHVGVLGSPHASSVLLANTRIPPQDRR